MTIPVVESLEGRALLAWSATLIGSTAVFISSVDLSQIDFIQDRNGNLEHNATIAPAGQSFADALDFDSTVPGSQHLAASATSTVDVGGQNFILILGDIVTPATTLFAHFSVAGDPNSFALVTDASDDLDQTFDVTAHSITSSGLDLSITGGPLGDGLFLETGYRQSVVNVESTASNQPLNISHNTEGTDQVNVGDGTEDLAASILSSVAFNPINDSHGFSLTIKSKASSGATATLAPYGFNGEQRLTGLTAPGTSFSFYNLAQFNLMGGNGGNNFTFVTTPALSTISTGSGTNTVNLGASQYPATTIVDQGNDTINVGAAGSLAHLSWPVIITGSGPSTAVKIDGSADAAGKAALLIATGPGTADLTGLTRTPIHLPTGMGDSLSIMGGAGADSLAVDFSEGNPIVGGLTYSGRPSSTLMLQGRVPGGAFMNEDDEATGPGGTITLDESTIAYSGIKSVVDLSPVDTDNFAYTGGLDAVIAVGAGDTIEGMATNRISSTSNGPQFGSVTYANKANATINSGPGDDVVSLAGAALIAGTSTTVDGQAGSNTLDYDAGGATIVIAQTGIAGQATITRPGSGSLLVENFQRINVSNGQIRGMTNPPAPTFGAAPALKGVDGVPLLGVDVATYTSTDLGATPASFRATIAWGDGASTAGTIVADAGNPTVFHVEGSHTYSAPSPNGGFAVGVTVIETATNATGVPGVAVELTGTASIAGKASIADAEIVARGFTTSALAGRVDAQALVASFSYAGGSPPVSHFFGSIAWGDGTTSAFSGDNITATGATYLVEADHTYASFGTFPILVTIHSNGGSSATVGSTAVVADSPIVAPSTPPPINLTEGTPFDGAVVSFGDAGGQPASNFLTSIAWGDGRVTAGMVSASPTVPGQYLVSGSHTYAGAGRDPATVTIRDTIRPGGSMATIIVPVVVAGAAISQSSDGVTINYAKDRVEFTADVASFVSANPEAVASDFVASIRWGDASSGSYSAGLVTRDADGRFEVSGSHAYDRPRTGDDPYTITVTVEELASGIAANLVGQAVVADTPLVAQGAVVSAIEGSPTSATIATFDYAGGPTDPSYFSGTVAWGDGTSSPLTAANFIPFAPTLPPQSGPLGTPPSDVASYRVVATHTYATPGTFPISIELQTANGSTALASSSGVVGGPLEVVVRTLGVAVGPFEVVAGAAFDRVVAILADSGPIDPASAYLAAIDWGDGSPASAGMVVAGPGGTLEVLGSHSYPVSGIYVASVAAVGPTSGLVIGTGIASVVATPINLTGLLNPYSDTGVSDLDAITADNRPDFLGSAAPGTRVSLYAIPVGTEIPVPIGSTTADASGAWSIASIAMADGRYDIEAIGVGPAGTAALDVLLPDAFQGPLVVDTSSPRVQSVSFRPGRGSILVTLRDDASGLDRGDLLFSANYGFAPTKGPAVAVTDVSAEPPAGASSPEQVVIAIHDAPPIRGGRYRFTIRLGGIKDIAGNVFDTGGDFAAILDVTGRAARSPTTVLLGQPKPKAHPPRMVGG